ncbi:MAG: hypothetical protein A2705_01075 [Omnitrophica WOR_2 bacterium RIFCSPHIGHO2_01_FULL_52_10]|nr:MAG: hypothetical protein A2705_01075 [Omnitrophica WOR_2 bacterium RIFCSPHIGHO2_01_FULL_52_10]
MLLELKNIRKSFPVKGGSLSRPRSFVRAVDGVDLALASGENLGLVGESGCGKTTLGRVIVKLTAPESGNILFAGKDITFLPGRQFREYRKKMQMVFQDPYSSLDPRFTVCRILEEAMTLEWRKYSTSVKRRERAAQLLKAVGLTPGMMERFPHEFSGGERQRIAIARALVLNPKLLILDEAVSSLDVLMQQQILDLLDGLQKEFQVTYLFISHNLRVVAKISRRIAVMYQGRIVESAPTRELLNNPLHPYTKELLAAAVDYKTSVREQAIAMDSHARLVDKGNGHWVLTDERTPSQKFIG